MVGKREVKEFLVSTECHVVVIDSSMRCFSPRTMKREGEIITFPCGICPACKARNRNEWHFRIMQELKYSTSAYFMTLTYRSENLPVSIDGHIMRVSDWTYNPVYQDILMQHPIILKKDIQDFLKRVRYYVGNADSMRVTFERHKGGTKVRLKRKVSKIASKGPNLRYFIIGEYGGKKGRPHYHVLIFNLPYINNLQNFIEFCWGHGDNIHIGDVSNKSVLYTVSYMISELLQKDSVFRVMSKGIGKNYVNANKARHGHTKDLFGMINNRKVPLPRYLKNQIFNKFEREVLHAKLKVKIEDSEKDVYNQIINRGENPAILEFENRKQYIEKLRKNKKNKL